VVPPYSRQFLGHDTSVFHTVDFTPESDPALASALRSPFVFMLELFENMIIKH